MHVLATPVASVGHSSARDRDRLAIRAAMTEQMHRVVLRDADQREAERERDAVNGAEDRADRGKPGQPQRWRAAARSARCCRCAAIGDQQQHDHADGRGRAERLRLPARALLHQHREFARRR